MSRVTTTKCCSQSKVCRCCNAWHIRRSETEFTKYNFSRIYRCGNGCLYTLHVHGHGLSFQNRCLQSKIFGISYSPIASKTCTHMTSIPQNLEQGAATTCFDVCTRVSHYPKSFSGIACNRATLCLAIVAISCPFCSNSWQESLLSPHGSNKTCLTRNAVFQRGCAIIAPDIVLKHILLYRCFMVRCMKGSQRYPKYTEIVG